MEWNIAIYVKPIQIKIPGFGVYARPICNNTKILNNTKKMSYKTTNLTGNWSNTSCSLGGSSTTHENLEK